LTEGEIKEKKRRCGPALKRVSGERLWGRPASKKGGMIEVITRKGEKVAIRGIAKILGGVASCDGETHRGPRTFSSEGTTKTQQGPTPLTKQEGKLWGGKRFQRRKNWVRGDNNTIRGL